MVTRTVSPKPKSNRQPGELARHLARERVMCPGCGKHMAITTLPYTHLCSGAAQELADEVNQRRPGAAKSRAIDACRHRHGKPTWLVESNTEAGTEESQAMDCGRSRLLYLLYYLLQHKSAL